MCSARPTLPTYCGSSYTSSPASRRQWATISWPARPMSPRTPSKNSSGHGSRSGSRALRPAYSGTTRRRVASIRTTSPPTASSSSYNACVPCFSRTSLSYSPGTLAYPSISTPPFTARSRTSIYCLSRPTPRRPVSRRACFCNTPCPSSPASYRACARPSCRIAST